MPAARSSRMPLQNPVNKLAGAGKKGAWAALIFGIVMLFFAKPDFNVSLSAMNTVSTATQSAEDMVSKVWDMAFNKIYLMTEGETLNELQLKGDRLVEMIAHERRYGCAVLRALFLQWSFRASERQQQNFAAWKKFWNPDRITRLIESIREASLTAIGFTA